MPSIQLKRGLKASLPTTSLKAGEPHITTDQWTIHLPEDSVTMKAARIAVEDYDAIPSINGSEDLLPIWDTSEAAAPKLKKVTFDSFKTALNIPSSSTDEKVSVVDGGTSGFLWGTTGADGVLRMGSSMTWTKDPGNEFVTLAVNEIDCGTF